MKNKRRFFKVIILALLAEIMFITCEQTYDVSLTISPESAFITKGGTQNFTAAVTGDINFPQDVTWSVSGSSNPNTVISSGGVLKVAANETSPTLTVIATSIFDNWLKKTAAVLIPEAIPLPLFEDTWTNGNIASSGGVQWFKFTATTSTQFIHVSFGTLTNLDIQLYDSGGNTVGSSAYFSGNTGNTGSISRTVTSGQVYYIKVWPYSSSYSGTYRIAFNTSIIPTSIVPTPLTENTWSDGNIPSSGGEQWFSFTATSNTQFIHVSFGTLTNLYVLLYDSSGNTVGSSTNLAGSTKFLSRSVTSGQVYYIKVLPYYSNGSGTYSITFNTSILTSIDPIPLTENTWADGNISSGGVQWFSFTATSNTQFIHVSFGTLTNLYVQLYNSSGNTVVTANLYGSTKFIPLSVTSGQMYYIKVWPSSSDYSGTYSIRFNTSFIPTPIIPTPLTENTLADGNIPSSDGEQWFSFTATSSTQYIHVSFGTLTNLYIQLYNSSGYTVGSSANLYGSTRYASRALTSGQMYYIRVLPSSSSYSGTYSITFNTSILTSIDPIPLTENTWADGNITSSSGEQWFSFTATSNIQYIHVSFGTLTNLYVQLYNSNGNTVGSSTNLYGSTKFMARFVTSGQVYYIRVWPYYSSGTYSIAFNTSIIPTSIVPTPLTENTWADGNITSSSGEQWFSFTATSNIQYIHVSFGTLTNLYVQLYNSNGNTVGSSSYLNSSTRYASRSVTSGQVYYIRVWPYSSAYSGTYSIAFNTSFAIDATPLTENTWAGGNIPSSSGEQWFSFTATSNIQYIHVSFGTLTNLYVQLYNSNGNTVGSSAYLYGSTKSMARLVTSGQMYYIRVWPYSSAYSGTYRITFNDSTTAPPL